MAVPYVIAVGRMEIELDSLLRDHESESGEWREDARNVLVLVAGLDAVGAGQALLTVLGLALAQAHHEIDTAPERDDKQLRRDLVFKLGGNDAVKQVLGLPAQARAVLKQIEAEVKGERK